MYVLTYFTAWQKAKLNRYVEITDELKAIHLL